MFPCTFLDACVILCPMSFSPWGIPLIQFRLFLLALSDICEISLMLGSPGSSRNSWILWVTLLKAWTRGSAEGSWEGLPLGGLTPPPPGSCRLSATTAVGILESVTLNEANSSFV